MVVLNILKRQKDKLLGPQVTVDIKQPYDEENLKDAPSGLFGLSYCTTIYLILTVTLMFTVICTSGVYLYDEYKSIQSHKYQGWCNIPLERNEMEMNAQQLNFDAEMLNDETLHEYFEIMEDVGQAKIDVPDFRDGKKGRFMHDFNSNTTAIIDVAGMRCFIMPLNRSMVLPPRNLIDLLFKMERGYYDVNMTVVKETMIAVLPPIKDLSKVSLYVIRECLNFPIYQLEKVNRTVVKRSADPSKHVKFVEFAGNLLQEYDIINLAELKNYEETNLKSD